MVEKRSISIKPVASVKKTRRWAGVSQPKRKQILVRLLRQHFFQSEKIMPAHSVSHHINGLNVVEWFAKKTRLDSGQARIAEIAFLLHDIKKGSISHAQKASVEAIRLLDPRMADLDVFLVSLAIQNHNSPVVVKGTKRQIFKANTAVLFADRMEALGAYGAMRISAFIGESQATASLDKESTRKAIVFDAKQNLMYSTNLGEYKKGRPVRTISFEAFFPSEALMPYRKGVSELRQFVFALQTKQPWAMEIADYFSKKGTEGKKDLNELVADFSPETARAKRFKQRALAYVQGKI